ncbi:alpha/beta fold hydrolase [Actinomyces slackii]|uniref:2-hydroxymuconic semialdehyde hydrolase n=2 Tax=Actinomyces slackii TaxID=52774 RepID=A0A448K945_9ACTO|nr:2-hydroxymuconic semialdehyde hydrolase [Actinomyces slackii]
MPWRIAPPTMAGHRARVACAVGLGLTACAAGAARWAGRRRLARYPARSVELSHGRMVYLDGGDPDGAVVVSLHGLCGGHDQGYDAIAEHAQGLRIIAPSRFGYLGSQVRGEGTPAEQSEALVELLDHLGIERAVIMGASAGGTAAIRFALDHPERTRGLILLSSAMPLAEPVAVAPRYMGPPRLMLHDLPMLALSPLFPLVMSMPVSTVAMMLPIGPRRRGCDLDARLSNPDMARRFAQYPIEALRPPVLILHARDDRLAPFEAVRAALGRFPDAVLVPIRDGGHLLAGHRTEVAAAITGFITALDPRA